MAITSVSRPAPTLGWVTNKNVAAMLPGEALVLDNYFPQANTVDLINGDIQYATGMGSEPVETLMVWNAGQITTTLAACSGSIYRLTGLGSTPVSIGSSYISNRWQWINFGNDAGQFTLMVNGSDPYQYYNGTTITVPTITVTGYTSRDFAHVHIFKGRPYFTIKDKLIFCYLGLGEVQGTVSLYDVTKFAKRGGYIMSIGTWTRDGGSGLDDFLVVVTSEGEALIYQGSDPSSADDWSLVGVFQIGRPLGRRCLGNYRNDLAVLTYDGFIPLSQVISLDRQNVAAVAISTNINPTVTASAQAFGLNFGWEMCLYPKQKMGIFNVPMGSMSAQYVVNTDTGAWCRFTQFNASTWVVSDNNLFYGGPNGTVYQADTGDNIHGSPISGIIECAYDYFGDSSSNKQYQMIRPNIVTSGNLNYQYGLNVDFIDSMLYGSGTTSGSGIQTPWGSPWGSPWSTSVTLTSRWISGSKIGRCASFKFRTVTSTQRVSVQSIDWAWQKAGLL